jgi:MFS family permease
MCNDMALCLSVIIVPLAIEDISSSNLVYDDENGEEELDSGLVAAQVARVSSMAFLGGAIGKFINGFVCDELGPYRCSRWYLMGMAVCNVIFSFSQNTTCMGLAFGGMEFFSSIQYAALSIMLSNYYSNHSSRNNNNDNNNDNKYHDPQADRARLTKAWTALGLASTIGDVLAKTLGSALNIWFHSWRRVAHVGSAVCLLGAIIICQAPGRRAAEELHAQQQRAAAASDESMFLPRRSFSWTRIGASLRNLLGTRLFWSLALSYAIVFVTCYSDRLMVPFYNEMSGFSQEVCGGLTLSITLGLVHGLMTGSETYTHLHNVPDKRRFFRNRYLGNVLALCGMAGIAWLVESSGWNVNLYATAGAVFFFSSAMASTMSFEFFQMPIIIAQKYESEKAVCISFLDGFGFLFSIPVFSALGVVVPKYGWSVGWCLVAAMSLIGGIVFVQNIGPILMTHADDHLSDEHDLEFLYYYEWASNIYKDEAFKAQASIEGILTYVPSICDRTTIQHDDSSVLSDHDRCIEIQGNR